MTLQRLRLTTQSFCVVKDSSYFEKYHIYTSDTTIFIKTNIERLVRIHGKQHPELELINRIFDEMTGHLIIHMKHEEFILFPKALELEIEYNIETWEHHT